MARVIGIGGVFFKSSDVPALREWYRRVLGIVITDGCAFAPEQMSACPGALTVLSPFDSSNDYFAPSSHEFMINFAVDDLERILARCKAEGVAPLCTFDEEPNGRFAHILDLEGRKIELWEPRLIRGSKGRPRPASRRRSGEAGLSAFQAERSDP